jgi:hypothetical protein
MTKLVLQWYAMLMLVLWLAMGALRWLLGVVPTRSSLGIGIGTESGGAV